MWPRKNTAFLVIHGVGAHSPLETLDLFARSFCETLKERGDDFDPNDILYDHCFNRDQADEVGPVEDNYVSISIPGRTCVQFHEYTWDFQRTRDIEFEEVIGWMTRMVKGAASFYNYNPKEADPGGQVRSDVFDPKGEFRPNRYLGLISGVWRYLGYVLWAADTINIPLLDGIIKWLRVFYRKFAEGFFGDLVTYLCTDVRSVNFAVKRRIQEGALNKVKSLIANDGIDQVIVVGHSLGSVIAYDALNLLNHELNSSSELQEKSKSKVTGLITFGSPLDKVAFTYYSDAEGEAHLHWQILDHLRSFKSVPMKLAEPIPGLLTNPLKHILDEQITWFNFYHRKDLVSGSLDAYEPNKNIRYEVDTKGAIGAHTFYWKHQPMYDQIIDTFFGEEDIEPARYV